MSKSETAGELNSFIKATKLSLTPEGILAGQICNLIAEGARSEAAVSSTFLQAIALIRAYGDNRVKDFRNAH